MDLSAKSRWIGVGLWLLASTACATKASAPVTGTKAPPPPYRGLSFDDFLKTLRPEFTITEPTQDAGGIRPSRLVGPTRTAPPWDQFRHWCSENGNRANDELFALPPRYLTQYYRRGYDVTTAACTNQNNQLVGVIIEVRDVADSANRETAIFDAIAWEAFQSMWHRSTRSW